MGPFYFLLICGAVVGLPFAACFAVQGLARLVLPTEEKMEAGLYGAVAFVVTLLLMIVLGLFLLATLKPQWA